MTEWVHERDIYFIINHLLCFCDTCLCILSVIITMGWQKRRSQMAASHFHSSDSSSHRDVCAKQSQNSTCRWVSSSVQGRLCTHYIWFLLLLKISMSWRGHNWKLGLISWKKIVSLVLNVNWTKLGCTQSGHRVHITIIKQLWINNRARISMTVVHLSIICQSLFCECNNPRNTLRIFLVQAITWTQRLEFSVQESKANLKSNQTLLSFCPYYVKNKKRKCFRSIKQKIEEDE